MDQQVPNERARWNWLVPSALSYCILRKGILSWKQRPDSIQSPEQYKMYFCYLQVTQNQVF